MALGESTDTGFQSIVIAGLSSKGFGGKLEKVRAILFVAQREQSDAIPDELLQVLFGLTCSEATLVSQLIEGKGLGIAAKKSAIGINTARTHLKKAFWKTNTSRQAELIRVLLRSVGFVRFD